MAALRILEYGLSGGGGDADLRFTRRTWTSMGGYRLESFGDNGVPIAHLTLGRMIRLDTIPVFTESFVTTDLLRRPEIQAKGNSFSRNADE
jgi:hypothetical protein